MRRITVEDVERMARQQSKSVYNRTYSRLRNRVIRATPDPDRQAAALAENNEAIRAAARRAERAAWDAVFVSEGMDPMPFPSRDVELA